MTRAYPVLIETHGKQSYVFATGRRRDAVGASYLVHAVTDTARDALGPTGRIADGAPAELLVATSGTVLAFLVDRDRAVALVRAVTRATLTDAPGLGVTGVVGDAVEWDSGGAPAAVAATFRRMGVVRHSRPGPASRFPMTPLSEPCPSSGLPVAGLVRIGGEPQPRSASSIAKLRAVDAAVRRLAALSGLDHATMWRATELLAGDGEEAPERVAVVHADGNGLGGLVSRLGDRIEPAPGEGPDSAYARGYRDFSAALVRAAEGALRAAIAETAASGRVPVVLPLIVGGDDLTFVADAVDAPALTALVLRRFVELAAAEPALAGPVAGASGVGDPRLGMGAGMVITGPHFPFDAAYGLAEELLTDVAKTAKTALLDDRGRPVPCISLAYHVQSDTVATGNAQRLAALCVDGRSLTGGPYVDLVTAGAPERDLAPDSKAWLNHRGLGDLFAVARRFGALADGRRELPSAQVHEIRNRLRPDPAAADEYLRRLVAADRRWTFLDEGTDSAAATLFTDRGEQPPTSRFLDALTLAPFTGPAPEATSA